MAFRPAPSGLVISIAGYRRGIQGYPPPLLLAGPPSLGGGGLDADGVPVWGTGLAGRLTVGSDMVNGMTPPHAAEGGRDSEKYFVGPRPTILRCASQGFPPVRCGVWCPPASMRGRMAARYASATNRSTTWREGGRGANAAPEWVGAIVPPQKSDSPFSGFLPFSSHRCGFGSFHYFRLFTFFPQCKCSRKSTSFLAQAVAYCFPQSSQANSQSKKISGNDNRMRKHFGKIRNHHWKCDITKMS